MIDELKKSDPNYNNRTFADLNFIMHVVAYRWFVGKNKETGMDEEAKEAFSLFDKNKRGYASQKEISNILSAHLGYELSTQEVLDFMAECDPESTGLVSYDNFKDLYLAWI